MSKYQHIYNSINDVVFIHHASSGEILFANNRCQEVYGYTPEELMEGGLQILSAGDVSDDLKRRIVHLKTAANGEEQIFEWKTKHANGNTFWVEVRMTPIVLDDVKRVISLIRDITDRKTVIEALARSEQFQKAVNFFSSSLINKNSEEEILWDVVQNCIEVLSFEDVVIYLIDDQNKLIQKAAYGDKKTKDGHVSEQLILSFGEGIVGYVAQSGEGVIISDLSIDNRYIVDVVRRSSEISVPIKYQGEVLGVIDSEHPQKNFYTELHLEIIETIASLTAIKIIQARSEEEVRKSEKRLKSILESSPDLIFVLDKDAVYQEVYTINEDLLAAPKEKLIGEKIDNFIPKEEVGLIKESIQRVLKTKRPESREYMRLKSNGEKGWFSAQIAYFEYQNNPSVILLSRDITVTKKAHIETFEREKLLASINQNISEGMYRSYAAGGLVYVNQAFVDMYGYDSEEEILKVRSLDLYADPSSRSGATQSIKKDKYKSNVEVLYKRKDGSTFWGLNSYILTTDQDGNEIFDGAIRDISKQKKVALELEMLNRELTSQNSELALKEQELETFNEELISNRDNLVNILEELSDRNFELDQLVYRTSHDLRAPLRSVLGLTNLYNIEVKNPPNTYVQKIEERIYKMDDFIKSMLDYSRASRLSVKYTEIDIDALINECLTDLEFLEEFKQVDLIKKIKTNSLKVVTDKLLLKIILSNIISNAFKYRNSLIENSFLRITVDVQQTIIDISMKDNGIGIAKEHADKVFDMFYRATEKSDGSGLGMYIVKQSIDKLKGSITVESKEEIGTTFNIKIPNQL